jgi:uncharacterized protein (UPF0248 family)
VLELVSLGDLGNIIISDGAGHREQFDNYHRILDIYKETGEVVFAYSKD